MSTVTVNKLQTHASNAATEFFDSSGREMGRLCMAYINFNGTGTIAIRDSFNVTSITDNGTADYTINWANAFPSSTYVPVSMGKATALNQGNTLSFHYSTAPTTNALRVYSYNIGSGTTDIDTLCIAVFGG